MNVWIEILTPWVPLLVAVGLIKLVYNKLAKARPAIRNIVGTAFGVLVLNFGRHAAGWVRVVIGSPGSHDWRLMLIVLGYVLLTLYSLRPLRDVIVSGVCPFLSAAILLCWLVGGRLVGGMIIPNLSDLIPDLPAIAVMAAAVAWSVAVRNRQLNRRPI